MGRVSYELSDDNRRRLELLTAFGILNGHYPSRAEILGICRYVNPNFLTLRA